MTTRVGMLDAQRFSIKAGADAVYDQICKPGEFLKEGESVTFDHSTLSSMVRNFSKQRNPLPADVEHQLCYVPMNGQPAPLAARYDSLVLVEGGRVTAYHSQTGASAPDVAGWDDGLFGRRSEVTPFGRDLLDNKGYGFISPTFMTDGMDAQGNEQGYTLLSASWVNLPFLDGMQPVTFARLGAPSATPGAHAMAASDKNGIVLRVGDNVMYRNGAMAAPGTVESVDGRGASVRTKYGIQYLVNGNNKSVEKVSSGSGTAPNAGPMDSAHWPNAMSAAPTRAGKGATTMALQVGDRVRHRNGATGRVIRINAGEGGPMPSDGIKRVDVQWDGSGEWDRAQEDSLTKMSTSAVRRFNNQGAPMDPEKMAARFGFAPDDSAEQKLAKCMAALADEEVKAMGELEIVHKDEEDEKEAEAMAADLGVEPGPKMMSRMRAALNATRAPVTAMAALQGEVKALSQKLAARDQADADAKINTFADDAIRTGKWNPEKRAELVTFAKADMKAATASLQPEGTWSILARYTAGLDSRGNGAAPVSESNGVTRFGVSLSAAAHKFARDNKVSFEKALVEVAKADPALASDYLGR